MNRMNTTAEHIADRTSVSADITYALHTGEKPVNETFEPGQVIRRRSGATETRSTVIRDGRACRDALTLDVTGFQLVDHATRVENFFDPAQLTAIYYPEVEALVRATSGASRVVVFDHTLRTGDVAEQQE